METLGFIAIGAVIIIIAITIYLYNKIVGLKIRCDNAWSQIDNQLKRRADLIPNLVEVTKGYAKHESETLLKITEARASANDISEIASHSKEVSQNLTRLLAVTESYPDLKANEIYKNLQIELVGTEDKISFARQFYNDSIQLYNTAIMVFPNNIMANILKCKSRPYFEISDEDRKVVSVNL